MSLLNLNSPEGRSPRGKKSSRVWMGFGLIIAVLGLGSTFAANIQINNDETSEFGQGLTQTVYCGSESPYEITVTPISSFVNSTTNPGSDAVAPTWTSFTGTKGNFVEVDEDSSSKYRSIVQYQNPVTGAVINNQAGYWIKTRNSSSDNDIYKGSSSNTSPNGFPIFVPQERVSGDYGYYRYTNWVDGFFSGGRDAVPPSSTPTKFELGAVKITNIPSACVGVDFVISGYGSGSSPLKLSEVLDVTEIAANYDSDGSPEFSFDRTTPGVTPGNEGDITVTQDEGSLKFTFTSGSGRLLSDDLTKIVVETQENIVG